MIRFLLISFFLTPVSALAFPAGQFFGSGTFHSNALNDKIWRPYSLSWDLKSDGSEQPQYFEAICNSAIINSTVIHFFGKRISSLDGVVEYSLYNEDEKLRGKMKCQDARCEFTYVYRTNFIFGLRITQKMNVEWNMTDEGFLQKGKYTYPFFPFITFEFNDKLIRVD